jgi:hypothetical protein
VAFDGRLRQAHKDTAGPEPRDVRLLDHQSVFDADEPQQRGAPRFLSSGADSAFDPQIFDLTCRPSNNTIILTV